MLRAQLCTGVTRVAVKVSWRFKGTDLIQDDIYVMELPEVVRNLLYKGTLPHKMWIKCRDNIVKSSIRKQFFVLPEEHLTKSIIGIEVL